VTEYNMFAVSKPRESLGALYPVLDAGFTPVPEEGDGATPKILEVRGMYVLGKVGPDIKILNGSRDLSGRLSITDQRISVVCRNYDKVRWDGLNNANAAFYGLGTEAAFHVAEKAFKRVVNSGKAMTAHLYFPWIAWVGWKPATGRKDRAAIRFSVELPLKGGGVLQRHMELRFDDGTGTSELARSIVQRIARWWLALPFSLPVDVTERLTKLSNAPSLAQPAPGTLSTYQMPKNYAVSKGSTPSAIAAAVQRHIDQRRAATGT
jgi:hypothetical protein